MRQPTGSPRLNTLFKVQFFGLPGPRKYAMSPRRIRLPVFFSGAWAEVRRDATARPPTLTTRDRMMANIRRTGSFPPPQSLTHSASSSEPFWNIDCVMYPPEADDEVFRGGGAPARPRDAARGGSDQGHVRQASVARNPRPVHGRFPREVAVGLQGFSR